MKKKTKIDLIELEKIQAPNEDPPGASNVKSMKKSILIFAAAGSLFVAGGVGAAGYLGWIDLPGLSSSGTSERTGPGRKSEMGPTIKLGPLVVNLKEDSGRNYLKAAIVLEVAGKDCLEEVQSRVSPLTDLVISTVSDKGLEDLKQSQSMENIKRELLTKMNQHLGSERIKSIYFDEFLYQ